MGKFAKKIRRTTFPFMPESFQEFYSNWENKKKLAKWEQQGKPVPPPEALKRQIVHFYQKEFNAKILVETGTYYGDMIWSQRKVFDTLYSIELSETLHKKAIKRFKKEPNIYLFHGDSGNVLPEILKKLDQPAIFWLDGHYSGGETARGEKDCPIIAELTHIFSSKFNHILLIDDARCFVNEGDLIDYPTIDYLKEFILSKKPQSTIEVENDIIRVIVRG
jgi:hypothetical protein